MNRLHFIGPFPFFQRARMGPDRGVELSAAIGAT